MRALVFTKTSSIAQPSVIDNGIGDGEWKLETRCIISRLAIEYACNLKHNFCNKLFQEKMMMRTYVASTKSENPNGKVMPSFTNRLHTFELKQISFEGDLFLLENLYRLLYFPKMQNDPN